MESFLSQLSVLEDFRKRFRRLYHCLTTVQINFTPPSAPPPLLILVFPYAAPSSAPIIPPFLSFSLIFYTGQRLAPFYNWSHACGAYPLLSASLTIAWGRRSEALFVGGLPIVGRSKIAWTTAMLFICSLMCCWTVLLARY
jgi:hypothetical protein